MSILKVQLWLSDRPPNFAGVRIVGADIIDGRELRIQVETAGDHTPLYKCGHRRLISMVTA